MENKITLFNFDNAYTYQDFYTEESYQWLNFTDLRGVNGYCDDEGLKTIRKRITESERTQINYIDSGNYHYITYLLLEHIQKPFTLILFDHHTDMQPSLFENLMSCGCWVKRALDENSFLKEVIIIGVADQLVQNMPSKYKDRVFTYGENLLNKPHDWQAFAKKYIHYDVYVSVDKDVIDSREARTNWDQGILSLKELGEIYECIVINHNVIGVDICGEYINDLTAVAKTANLINNNANRQILEFIEEVSSTKEASTRVKK